MPVIAATRLGRMGERGAAEGLEAFGALGDEVGVDERLIDDCAGHRQQQGHVGVGAELQEAVGMARQRRLARVHEDQLRAALVDRVLHEGGRHRVVGTAGLAPMTMMRSANATSRTGFETAPELMPSSSAATEEAWHSRVQ